MLIELILKIIVTIIGVLLLPLVNKWFPKDTGSYADADEFTVAYIIAFLFVIFGLFLFGVVKIMTRKRIQRKE